MTQESHSTDQLLTLLKRAAEELKYAKEEAHTAVLALQKEQEAHRETETELQELKEKAASSDPQLLKDQVDAERDHGKTLDSQVRRLEQALEQALHMHKALETRAVEAETAVQIAEQQTKARLERQAEEHRAALAAQLEKHQSDLEEQHKLTSEQETLKSQCEGFLQQERERHQHTAQKLLETRSRVRELEATLHEELQRCTGIEAAAKKQADEQAQSLNAQAQALQEMTGRWQQVERQYEALHKEMLLTLEQRDEARRQLEALKLR